MTRETDVPYENPDDFYAEMTFDRIVRDRSILGGKPTIKGTRISVEIVLEWLASGGTFPQILADFPHLTRDDLEQAVYYAVTQLPKPLIRTEVAAS